MLDILDPSTSLGPSTALALTLPQPSYMCPPAHYEMANSHGDVSSPEANEIPQRSRNARAQARHRAKRKAYIEKLEENVAKLQAVLGLSSEQVSELPPAAVLTNRYAELEMENQRLHEQLRSLQLSLQNMRYNVNGHNGARWSPDSPTVSEFSTQGIPINLDDPNILRGSKKRKISFDEDAPYLNGHSHLANGEMTTNSLASRAHPPQASVNQTATRGRSADTNASAIPFSNPYSQNANVNANANGSTPDQMNPITVKSEPSFGDLSILSPTLAGSPITMQRQQQMHHQHAQHRSSGPININMNHPPPGQGPYRMSFSPTSERDYQHPQHHQQQSANTSTYSGIVGGAARSIFGSSDDEAYLPNQPSPMDSRGYPDHQQQQYLAHERLASIAERAAHQAAASSSGSMHHPIGINQHQFTQNRPSVPPFPMELHTGVYTGGGLPSPVHPSPGGGNNWPTVVAAKRA